MENDLLIGLMTEPDKVIAKIREQSKDVAKILEFRNEYLKHERNIRDTQIGKTQTDKDVGAGEKSKRIKAVRTPVNFAKKIVTTATAFEVGKPVTLIPSEENDLSNLVYQTWKVNRIDSSVQKLVSLRKSETQAAIQFYISDLKTDSILNKILVKMSLKVQAKEIKSKILDNSKGVMTPYFDGTGNLILFMWEYTAKNSNGKETKYVEIWDELNYHFLNDESGKLLYAEKGIIPHGFDRIPIVYDEQDDPEWFVVRELIDRFETALSKLGGSNDYTAYPILQIFGEIKSFPDKEDNGKVLNFPIKIDDQGKAVHGRGEFLTADNSAENAKIEFEYLKELIFSISHTPDLSFDNVKGLGSVSGIALKLMFLDAIVKATMNEGQNRTMIERIINIIISGTTKTTNTTTAKMGQSLYFDIIFNSIIPTDLQAASEVIRSLKESGLLSTATAIKLLDMVEDPVEEMNLIKAEKPKTEV